MIRQLPGGGLVAGISSGIGSQAAERDEEAAEQLWNGYMDQIRRRATMRTRPVRAALDAGEHHAAAVAALFLERVDDYRSGAAAARLFLEHVARNG